MAYQFVPFVCALELQEEEWRGGEFPKRRSGEEKSLHITIPLMRPQRRSSSI